MSCNEKIILASKGDNALNESQVWQRISEISQQMEDPVEIISSGKQNTPLSDRYMKYLQAKFTMFIVSQNRCFTIDALIVFQKNTEILERNEEIICSISTSGRDFNNDLLLVLAHHLAPFYDLYSKAQDEPPKKLSQAEIQERLTQRNYNI